MLSFNLADPFSAVFNVRTYTSSVQIGFISLINIFVSSSNLAIFHHLDYISLDFS